MNFIYKFNKFMMGRNGSDNLYNFLFFLYFFLLIVNLFIDSSFVFYVETFIIIFMFYRFFSKNLTKRKRENEIYLKIKNKVMHPFKTHKTNDFIYKKCHKCKTILRLPLPAERGIKCAKCPTCGNRVKFLCLKKQKVEIIL